MATKKVVPQTDLLNLNPTIIDSDPLERSNPEAIDVWGQLIPKGNSDLGNPEKEAQSAVFNDLRWLEAKNTIQKRLAKLQPPPTIPQWETIRARITGWDELPYVEQKRLYDQYLEEAKSVFMAWNKNQPKAKQMDEFDVDKLFREYNPAPVKPERSLGDWFNDIKLGAQSGFAATLGSVGAVIDAMSGTPKENSKYWEDLVEAYDKDKSAVAKDARKKAAFELQKVYSDPDSWAITKLLKEAGIAVSNLSIDQAVSLVTQMLPSLFIGLATGGAGTVAGLGATASGRLATAMGAIVNAALTGGDAAGTARDAALAMTEKEIKSTPEGLQLWEDFNGDINKIRLELAKDASRSGAILGGILGTAGALIPGSAERAAQRGLTRASSSTLGGTLGSAATGALIGATEEGLTGIAGRTAAMVEGADVNLLEGAGSDFALGLLGEGIGGGAGHLGGRLMSSQPPAQATAEANEKTIADAIKAINSSTAPSGSQTASPTAGVTQGAVDAVKQGLTALENQEQLESLLANANAQLEVATQEPTAEIEEVTAPVGAVGEAVQNVPLPTVSTPVQVQEPASAPVQQPPIAAPVQQAPAVPAVQEAPVAETTVEETVVQLPQIDVLPKSLGSPKPRLNMREVDFENKLDLAAYIVGNTKTKSKSHQKFVDFIKEATGFSDAEVADYSARVVQWVKDSPVKKGRVKVAPFSFEQSRKGTSLGQRPNAVTSVQQPLVPQASSATAVAESTPSGGSIQLPLIKTLPISLGSPKPRLNMREVDFQNKLDLAAYIVGNGKTKSKSHQKFVDFIKEATGFSDAEIADYASKIVQWVKDSPVKKGRVQVAPFTFERVAGTETMQEAAPVQQPPAQTAASEASVVQQPQTIADILEAPSPSTNEQASNAATELPTAVKAAMEEARRLSDEQVESILSGNQPEGVSEPAAKLVRSLGFGQRLEKMNTEWAKAIKKKKSGKEVLLAIATDPNISLTLREMALNLIDAYEKAGIAIPPVNRARMSKKDLGRYFVKANRVELSKNADVLAVIHEYLHGLTSRGILSLENKAIDGDEAAKSQLALLKVMLDKLKEKAPDGIYGTYSIHEMLAELSSPDLVALAKSIPIGELPKIVEYTTEVKRYGRPISISASPQLAMNELNLANGNPIIEALAKLIKAIIDVISPNNRLHERTVLDALAGSLNSVLEEQIEVSQKGLPRLGIEPDSSMSTPVQQEAETPVQRESEAQPTIPENVRLPAHLRKTAVQFKGQPLKFENDLDRAAYMLGQRTKYRNEYADFIRDHLGYNDDQIADYTDRIVQQVKNTALKNGQRVIESSSGDNIKPRYATASAGALAADLTQGSDLDIQLEAAKDQGLPPVRQSFTDLLRDTEKGIPPSPATVGRRVYQALGTKKVDNVKTALSEVFDILGEKFADSMLPVKRWADSILDNADHLHKQVTDFLGAMYAAPNIREHHIVQAHKNGGKEFIQSMAAVVKKTGLSEEEVQQLAGYWTSAVYAPKANKRLIDRAMREVSNAQRQLAEDPANADFQAALRKAINELRTRVDAVTNPKIDTKSHAIGLAGGMSNAQADALRQACEARLGLDNLQAIAKGIYDMNAWRLTLDIETGKTTPEVAAAFLNRPDLKADLTTLRDAARAGETESLNQLRTKVAKAVRSDYVPLSGHPDGSLDGEVFGRPKGQNPNQQVDRRMEGRLAIPDDGITASFASMLKSAGYAGWRPFQEATAKLYLAMSPEERVAANFSRTTYDRIDAYPQGAILYRSNNGKTYAFQVDGELFDAIRKTNIEESGTLLQYISKPTRWFSYAATQLNPTFAPINMFRDVWERSDLVRAKDLRDANGNKVNANKVARAMWRYMFNPELWKATFRFAAGKASDGSKAARALQALAESGGISTRADYFAGSQAERVKAISVAGSKTKKLTGGAVKVIDVYNRTFDLISPLASYMAMTDANVTRNQASSVTLDLMNFRKTGSTMPLVKAIYAFAQPTITGGVNLLSSLVDRKSGKLNWRSVGRLAGYTVVLMAIQATARAIGGDDEGGEKIRQLSEWTRSNTIAFPVGDSVVTIPLGFGMPRLANAFAQSILDRWKNEQTLGQAFGSAVRTAVVPAISPIDPVGLDWSKKPAEAFMLTFSPTWLKTIAEVSMNVKSSGAPISHPEWEKTDQFRSEQGGTNCPEFYRDAARTVRQLTGIDMSPEQFAHIFRGYTIGAPGLLRTQFIENPFRAEQGKTIDNALTRRFVQAQSDQGIRTQFYDYLNDINDIRKKANAGEDLTDREKTLVRIGDQWDKVDRDFRSRISKISKTAGLSEETKAKRKAELRKQKEPYMFDFVRRVRMAEGKIVG